MIGVICQQEPRHWLGFDQHLAGMSVTKTFSQEPHFHLHRDSAGSRLKMPLGPQGPWFCILEVQRCWKITAKEHRSQERSFQKLKFAPNERQRALIDCVQDAALPSNRPVDLVKRYSDPIP